MDDDELHQASLSLFGIAGDDEDLSGSEDGKQRNARSTIPFKQVANRFL